MNLTEAIYNIKEARDDNQLVLFIGAGISINSGFPTWNSLINKLAQSINYDKCDYCKRSQDKANCPNIIAKDSCEYTTDELLLIPEYTFINNENNYKEIVNKEFNHRYKPNEIHNKILNILPHHIITTNYDNLIEETDNENKQLYKLVSKDIEMLSPSERYIIKMHGDLKDISQIVPSLEF